MTPTYNVTLVPHEILMAATVGMYRHVAAIARGCPDQHGARPELGWNLHLEGACGELAVAKLLNLYWNGSVNTFKLPDLPTLQVRTRSSHGHDLIIRDNDDQRYAYILVTGNCPEYVVRGWLPGWHVQQRRDWRKTYGGREEAWFVPHDALYPFPTRA